MWNYCTRFFCLLILIRWSVDCDLCDGIVYSFSLEVGVFGDCIEQMCDDKMDKYQHAAKQNENIIPTVLRLSLLDGKYPTKSDRFRPWKI